jgi:hypothetical protein
VTALHGALRLISRLQVREFCWAHDPSGERVAGFLAQEVKEVLPQVRWVGSWARVQAPVHVLLFSPLP